MRRILAALVLVALLPAAGGCFGRFELTRKLYGFNQEVSDDRWVRWLVFLGMAVFPIYEWGILIDAVFGNSVEFWGGRNPLAAGEARTRYAVGPNGEQLRVSRTGPGRLVLEVTGPEGETRSFAVVREGEALVARDAEGRTLARVATDGPPGPPLPGVSPIEPGRH